MTDHDASDEFTYCVTGEAVELGAKLAYYAARAFKFLRDKPPPAPP